MKLKIIYKNLILTIYSMIKWLKGYEPNVHAQ
jgi:hypothetical protein